MWSSGPSISDACCSSHGVSVMVSMLPLTAREKAAMSSLSERSDATICIVPLSGMMASLNVTVITGPSMIVKTGTGLSVSGVVATMKWPNAYSWMVWE